MVESVEAELDLTAGAAAPALEKTGAQSWWTLVIVSLLLCASGIDRGGLPLLVNPIKMDLGLSDVQIGLLMGFAYTMVQACLLMPAGYLVDRFNRRNLLSGSVALWSSISMMTGFAGNFFQLFGCRSGLAIGEATVMPAAHSLLRDAFPPERRGIAYSVYLGTISIAASLSLIVAASLINLADHGFFRSWPVLGHMKTWQIVLTVPGACTLPLALLILTMYEPIRRTSPVFKGNLATMKDALRYIREHAWVYWPFFTAIMISGYSNMVLPWMPTVLIRGWSLPAAEVGHITGTVGLVAALSGTLTGGFIMDRLTKRGIMDGPIRYYVISMSLAFLLFTAALHVHRSWLIYTLLGIGQFCFAGHYAALSITLATITPGRLMGRVTAFYFLLLGTIGGNAWGSTAIALVAKYCFSGPLALVQAVNAVLGVAAPMCLLLMLFAASRIGRFARLHPGGIG